MADFEQQFLERDGHSLGLQRYHGGGNRAILLLPAMGVPAGYYHHFATRLRDSGNDVAICDLRGTGLSQPRAARRVNFGYNDLINDVGYVCRTLRTEWGERETVFIGHSLGGQLGLLHLAQSHDAPAVSAVALIASGLPYHRLYGQLSPALRGYAAALSGYARLRGHWPGYGFGGRQPRRLMCDWANTVRLGSFTGTRQDSTARDMERIRQPVLAVTVDGDRLTPPATSRYLTDRLVNAPVEHFHCPSGDERLNHFNWARRLPDPLMRRLEEFLGTTA